MADRTLLLAGLIDDDDLEFARHKIVESYEEQFEDDRKHISENVSFIEEDEYRFLKLIGEEKEENDDHLKSINESMMSPGLGGFGPGFVNTSNVSSYSPSQSEAFGQIIAGGHYREKDRDLSDAKYLLFKKIAESNPGAFRSNAKTINEEDLPEFDENFNPILSESDIENRYSLFESESGKLHNGEMAVQGGIGPGFKAYDGTWNEVKNPYAGADSGLSRWYLGEMKEQPDLPGEIEDREDINYFEEENEDLPKVFNFPDMKVSYVGTEKVTGASVYEISNDEAVRIGLSKDGKEWYAQAQSSDFGLNAEEWGETPEEAIRNIIDAIYQESSLLETVEGTDGNSWHYRRTGTSGNSNINYRENGKLTMHPEATEDEEEEYPNLYAGLPGWMPYKADPTNQKMKAKMEDVLDFGEEDAEDDFLVKFIKKNSTHKPKKVK
jgi:hypothetical protein